MITQRYFVFVLLLGFLSVFSTAGTGRAAPSPSPANAAIATAPIFANTVSWHGFKRYWLGFVKNSDRVVVIVAIVAAAAVFIITRGKWM
jgi:hypothetical protein